MYSHLERGESALETFLIWVKTLFQLHVGNNKNKVVKVVIKSGWDWLGSGVNVEDDLRPRRRPLQVPPDADPQLVDVGVFAVVGRDGQRVGDGQQLRQTAQVLSFYPVDSVDQGPCWPVLEWGGVPSEERPVLGPASPAPRLQAAACPRTAAANPWLPTRPS